MPSSQLLPFLSYYGETNKGVKLLPLPPPPSTQIRVKKSFKSIDVDLAKHVLASNIN